MFTIDAAKFGDDAEDKVIEPEIKLEENKKTTMYEKYNPRAKSDNNNNILTKEFLRKYIYYAKSKINPSLTREATDYISKSWTNIREKSVSEEWKGKTIPVTVRTLESLIRLATAYAKARLSQKVEKQDALNAVELLTNSFFAENEGKLLEQEEEENQMDLVEEEEDDKKKKKNKKKEKREEILQLEEEEEEIDEKKSRKKKSKKSKEKKEIDDLVEAQIDEDEENDDGEVTEEMANVIFKLVYENAKRKPNQTIPMNELWENIKNKKECKDKKINNSRKLKNICGRLEDEGKIFVSENDEITLV